MSGTGFNDGVLVLSGEVISVIESNIETLNSFVDVGPLDGVGEDDYPGLGTVEGGGDTNLRVSINTVNDNFFVGLDPAELNLTFNFTSQFDTSQSLPFDPVDPQAAQYITVDSSDPSAAFVFARGGAAPITAGAGLLTTDPFNFLGVGSFNGGNLGLGGGPSVQYQAVGKMSFATSATGPEPASMVVWAVGAGFVPVLRRRRVR